MINMPASADDQATRKANVFISYSRRDERFAEELHSGLRIGGLSVQIDKQDITPGDDWESRLSALILTADTVVFVVSPSSITSDRCLWELRQAEKFGKRIIPVVWQRVEDASAPEQIKRLNYVFFDQAHSFAPSLGVLLQAIGADLEWHRGQTLIQQLTFRWIERGRPSDLLISGTRLQDAKDWLNHKQAKLSVIDNSLREFIRASEKIDQYLLANNREFEELRVIKGKSDHANKMLVRLVKAAGMAMVGAGMAWVYYSVIDLATHDWVYRGGWDPDPMEQLYARVEFRQALVWLAAIIPFLTVWVLFWSTYKTTNAWLRSGLWGVYSLAPVALAGWVNAKLWHVLTPIYTDEMFSLVESLAMLVGVIIGFWFAYGRISHQGIAEIVRSQPAETH